MRLKYPATYALNNPPRSGGPGPWDLASAEALALAAWKDGQADEALRLFELIIGDGDSPGSMRQRAQMMIELIRGSQAPA